MRYKDNVLEKLARLEVLVNKVEFEINRGMQPKVVNESIEGVKNQIEDIKGLIGVEPDDFAQQFK